MRKFLLTALLASSALGFASTSGIAGSYGYSAPYQHAQYGGGWNGGGHHEQCYWERKQVRIWDETYHRWTWVWRRVRICH